MDGWTDGQIDRRTGRQKCLEAHDRLYMQSCLSICVLSIAFILALLCASKRAVWQFTRTAACKWQATFVRSFVRCCGLLGCSLVRGRARQDREALLPLAASGLSLDSKMSQAAETRSKKRKAKGSKGEQRIVSNRIQEPFASFMPLLQTICK